MPNSRKRTLTLSLAATALIVVAGHHYGLPRIGIRDGAAIRVGTIDRLDAAPKTAARPEAAPKPVARATAAAAPQLPEIAPVHAASANRPLKQDRMSLLDGAHALAASTMSELPPGEYTAWRERALHTADADPTALKVSTLGPIAPRLTGPAQIDPEITGSIGAAPEAQAPIEEDRIFAAIGVLDGRSFKADGQTVRLAGVALPKADRTCMKIDGTTEPCTERARTRLDLITRHRPVACTLLPEGRPQVWTGHCKVGSTDLAAWLTREGWVTPTESSGNLAGALAEAKRMKVGLWR